MAAWTRERRLLYHSLAIAKTHVVGEIRSGAQKSAGSGHDAGHRARSRDQTAEPVGVFDAPVVVESPLAVDVLAAADDVGALSVGASSA